MKNFKITISYNGSRFFGWQKQQGKRTVQGVLEDAIFSLTGTRVDVEGSGRTDRGVHALGQVANFFLETPMPCQNLRRALNNLLPNDVQITKVQLADENFHARFCAKKKTYKYVVQVGGQKNAVLADTLAFYPYAVDLSKMQQAAQLFVGTHNFHGFCSAQTSAKTFERQIYSLTIRKRGRIFTFSVCGNGFLYNMVRIIVGTLLDVGRGQLNLQDVQNALQNGNRQQSGTTMPPNGLYLVRVEYDGTEKQA